MRELLVSAVIPSYNRFEFLLRAIASVRAQSYGPIEIVVINDASEQQEYSENDLGSDIVRVDLPPRDGRRDPGSRARNAGLEIAQGELIAFLDDDDIWMPLKIARQIAAMRLSGCEMCCSDGFLGYGPFEEARSYPRYNRDLYFDEIARIHRKKGSTALADGFPSVWTRDFLGIHNSAVCSSVVISRHVLSKVGTFRILPSAVDYDFWMRVLEHTDCAYVDEPLFYYDNGHGGGRHYRGISKSWLRNIW